MAREIATFFLASTGNKCYITISIAEVVELVDTQDSGSCAGNRVLVRVQSSAPQRYKSQVNTSLGFLFLVNPS